MKVVIDQKGNKYYWRNGDFSCLFGRVKEEDMKNGIIKTHIGKRLIVFDGSFSDCAEKIKRGPAVMMKKEIGNILVNTGLNKGSKVLDAGVGCGLLSSFLARISDNVVAYERNEEHFKIAEANFKKLGVKVELKLKDIYEGIDESELDLVTLDLLEPWKVLEHAFNALKSGGYLVCYVTNALQISQLIKDVDEEKFYLEKINEIIEREWDGIKVRPMSRGVMHSGFLVYLRRI
jgi:tRNA (adenine57-N1/adenine58-N1)-methyltransferase catalytic subunit